MENLCKFFFGNNSKNVNSGISLATLQKTLEAFENVCSETFYVIDLEKQDFFYKSHKLAAYLSRHGNAAYGSLLNQFLHCIPDSDMTYAQGFGQIFRELFNGTSYPQRYSLMLSGNFHVPLEQGQVLVYERVTPIGEDADGSLRFILCTLSGSSSKQAGWVQITVGDGDTKKVYSIREKKWITNGEVELNECTLYEDVLNEREKEVLNLAARGFTSDEMADKMTLSKESIKKCRKSIFEKTQTKSITQAFIRAHNLGMI